MNRKLPPAIVRYASAALLIVAFLSALPVTAQPGLWSFNTPIPCDSVACDSIPFFDDNADTLKLMAVEFRDSTSFSVASVLPLPITRLRGERYMLPICFHPTRRGPIVDSMTVYLRRVPGGVSAVKVRVIGTGIGPDLVASPQVLTFPKTNPGANSMLGMILRNTGERPYTLTVAGVVIPPPFRLSTPLPITILPGDSVQLDFIFEPTVRGVYSAPVDLAVCASTLQLALNGVTDLIGTGAVLRANKGRFNPINDEQTLCDVQLCTDYIVSNVGTATLVIDELKWAIGSIGYTITSSAATPFLIPPGGQKTIQICLQSSKRGYLRDTLVIKSNTRNSIAFGLVLDVSGSMKDPLACTGPSTRNIDQAIIQAQNFIAKTLLYIPSLNIQDQLAICTYTTTSNFNTTPDIRFPFILTMIDDVARAMAISSIGGLAPRFGTPTGAALSRMMDTLSKSPIPSKVLILLSDGEPTGPDSTNYPINTLIQRAKSLGIRIFTIGIGMNAKGRYYLSRYANGTNGLSFDGNDCDSLQKAFEQITDILSRGTITREPFNIKVLAPRITATQPLPYDSVLVGRTICQEITLTNSGDGDAIIDSLTLAGVLGGTTGEFALPPGVLLPITIHEGADVKVPVCFTPTRIRMRDGKGEVHYNNCGEPKIILDLVGPAYAWANLRVNDQRLGLPGTIVTMPVYADTALGNYTVDTIRWEVRWNKTMLDLRGVRPGLDGAGATVTIATPVQFGTRNATVGLMAVGKGLAGGGELAALDFEVLRGDTLATLVEIITGRFEDGNPKSILDNAGLIAFDSTCFRDFKPIGSTTVGKIAVGDPSPRPSSGARVHLPFTATEDATVELSLYDNNGAIVRDPKSVAITSGEGTLEIDPTGLPVGTYFIHLRTNAGETIIRTIVLVR